MGIGVIIFLVLLGLVLIWLEVLVIPGITISGIGGVLLIAAGVYLAFNQHGNTTGIWVLVGTLLLLIISIVYFLKSNTWNRISLSDSVSSNVEYFEEGSVSVGDAGKTITRLAPSGKIRVGEVELEGESLSGYLDPGTEIIVTEVLKYKVFVKLKT
jgi:membrane-bound ClpP family serine protease